MKLKDWKTNREWESVLRAFNSLPRDVVKRVPSLLIINHGNRRVIEHFLEYESNSLLGRDINAILGEKWGIIVKLYEYENDTFNMDRIGVVSTHETENTDNSILSHNSESDKIAKESAINYNEFVETNQDVFNQTRRETDNRTGKRTTTQRTQRRIEQELIDHTYDLAYNISVDIANLVTYKLY